MGNGDNENGNRNNEMGNKYRIKDGKMLFFLPIHPFNKFRDSFVANNNWSIILRFEQNF